MSDVSTNLYKSQLLDYYYQRRAESSINKALSIFNQQGRFRSQFTGY